MGFYIWEEWEDAVTTGAKLSEVSTTMYMQKQKVLWEQKKGKIKKR